jgi:hypothetical protein
MKFFVILVLICVQTLTNSVTSIQAASCPYNTNYCTTINITGGSPSTTVPKPLSTQCRATVMTDFAARMNMTVYPANCTAGDAWGPTPITFPTTNVSGICDSTSWMRQRVLSIISLFVNQSWNYCHHHTPSWLPIVSNRSTTNNTSGGGASGSGGQCSSNYWGSGTPNPNANAGWNGVDCTSYTSYVYNFGFGCYLNAATGNQACGPNAPGAVLPYTASQQSQFQPGDILFIAASSTANPLSISHGVLWTGMTLTYDNGPLSNATLLKNLDPTTQQGPAIAYINAQYKANQPVYIISDSHFAGPNYRPFAGWYVSAFTFARRLIYPNSTYSKVAKNAYYNTTSGTCFFTPATSG